MSRVDENSAWRQIAAAAWDVANDAAPASTLRLFEELVPYMDDSDPGALLQLASAYYYANDYVKASLFLEFVLERDLDDEQRCLAVLQMADSLRALGRGSEALRWLDRGLVECADLEGATWLTALKVRTLADLGKVDELTQITLELLGVPAEAHPNTSGSSTRRSRQRGGRHG